jgi:Cys-rich repeat protein
MTTRAAFVWAIGLCVSLAGLASGCHIKLDGNDFDEDHFDGDHFDDPGVCPAFCQHLMNCDNIAKDAFESCLSHCEQQRAATPSTTLEGIQCVVDQSCSSVMDYGCTSAPFPGVGGGNLVGICEADCDCPSGSACVAGTCKLPCNASCECAAGETCEGGYCQVPAEPPVTCTADCDCPGGNTCIEGICAPNG